MGYLLLDIDVYQALGYAVNTISQLNIWRTAEVANVLPSGDSVTPIIIIIFSLSLSQRSKHQIYQLSSACSSASPRL